MKLFWLFYPYKLYCLTFFISFLCFTVILPLNDKSFMFLQLLLQLFLTYILKTFISIKAYFYIFSGLSKVLKPIFYTFVPFYRLFKHYHYDPRDNHMLNCLFIIHCYFALKVKTCQKFCILSDFTFISSSLCLSLLNYSFFIFTVTLPFILFILLTI